MNDRPTEKLDDLMDEFVFGLLDEKTEARVKSTIESEPKWQLAYEAAVGRKRSLARCVGQGQAAPGVRASDALAAGQAIERRKRGSKRLVVGVFGGLAAAAMVVMGVFWIRYALVSQPAYAIRVLGQTKLMASSVASLQMLVTDAKGQPAAGVPVKLLLANPAGNAVIVLADWVSDAAGNAGGPVHLPDWTGKCELTAKAGGGFSPAQIQSSITLQRNRQIFLSTDKPIYQPGQAIHMRGLVMFKPSLKPSAGEQACFTVTDPANNVILSEPVKLSQFGIGWTDLPLDEFVAPGRYNVKLTAGDDSSEQTVEIFTYKLPAFAVKIKLDEPYYLPGQTITGELEARYHFGKPVVSGEVELDLTSQFGASRDRLKSISIETGADGKAKFRLPLPANLMASRRTSDNAELLISAKTIDSAGQQNTGYRKVAVAGQDIRVQAVGENGLLERGPGGKLFVVTSYPDGRPAKAVVNIETIGQSFRTDDAGVAVIAAGDSFANIASSTPQKLTLHIAARDERGKTGQADVQLDDAPAGSFILRTDKPIYEGGQTAAVQVIGPQEGMIYLDLVKDNQTILTKAVSLAQGQAGVAIDLPPDVAGTMQIHAYRLNDDGEWIGRDSLIVVRPANKLKVQVAADREVYHPGQDAKLAFTVTGPGGKATASALSLSAVDEAVYSVQQAAPGLEQTLIGLEEELLQPAVEAHNLSPSLLQDEDYARAFMAFATPHTQHAKPQGSRLKELQDAGYISERILNYLRNWSPDEIRGALDKDPDLREILGPQLVAELTSLKAGLHSLDSSSKIEDARRYANAKRHADSQAGDATFIGSIVAGLSLLCMLIAWPGRPSLTQRLPASKFASIIAAAIIISLLVAILLPSFARVQALSRRMTLQTELVAVGKAQATADEDRPGASPAARTSGGPGGREFANPVMALATESPSAAHGTEPDAPAVRTRTFFPETMLWRPEVITDDNGKAELTVPLADSITTWRLAGAAVGHDGQLGMVDSAIRVFQPFFVDVDAPLSLTAGDEVSLPLVLYNYSDGDLTIHVSAESKDGLSILQGAGQDVTIAPNQVKRAYVRVKADAMGEGAVTVNASAGQFADATRRTIRINPPGLPQSLAINGVFTEGRQPVELPIPADAVPGSVVVTMKTYPSTFSQLLDGLDGILEMPHGCFEQTSSTTYPNVMALAYMSSHNIAKPEAAAKATNYINLGCQRLLSFEVPGGGFEWFGNSPANVVLTAYGLMEFSDMAKVHNVDRQLLERTAGWLARQQAPSGAWRLERGIFHEVPTGADTELASTAYVTWAIATYDPSNAAVRRGAAYVAARLDQATTGHTLALCANALLTADPASVQGKAALRSLAEMAKTDSVGKIWPSPRAAMAFGTGKSADVEATALAIQALSHDPAYAPLVNDALTWIVANRDPSGAWGTTQATVQALRALVNAPRQVAARTSAAAIDLTWPGQAQELHAQVRISPDQSTVVHALRLEDVRDGGTYSVVMDAREASGMAYQFSIRYSSIAAARAQDTAAPLAVSVQYDRTNLHTGQTVGVHATVTNRQNTPQQMLLVDLGTPPGFAVVPDALDKLKAQGKIERYTLTARGVIVYLDSLAPRQSLAIDYQMVATMPLKAVAGPTTVYAYYQPELRASTKAAQFNVD